MAYYVSQLRKNNTNYMTNIISSITITKINSPNPFGDKDNPFEDFALKGITFTKDTVYYLRFQVKKIPQGFYSKDITDYEDADTLNLKLLLKNDGDNEDDNPPEIIGTCTVPKGIIHKEKNSNIYTCDEYSFFSFVFSPSKNFDCLVFRIIRTTYDAIYGGRNWLINDATESVEINSSKEIKVEGKRIDIKDNGECCILNNIINTTEAPNGWLKFGYQSRPGSLIVVNREPFRIGRSGIFEINNGTIINSFMIASPGGSNDNSKIDAFLLDYAYKK